MSRRSDTGPFLLVPHWVVDAVDARELQVYINLARFADHDGVAWPSVARLAELCSCSDRTVRYALTRLKDVGAVEVRERRRDDGGKTSNEYTILRRMPGDPAPVAGEDLQPVAGQELESVRTRTSELVEIAPKRIDEVWDALMELFGIDKIPPAHRSRFNRLVSELKAVEATPLEMKRRYQNHLVNCDWDVTPESFVKRWGENATVRHKLSDNQKSILRAMEGTRG